MSYEARPIDPRALLSELARDTVGEQLAAGGAGITPRQAAAWAVAHNPMLARVRARLGVAESELIEAGLLPDPQVGWDAMDVLAVKLAGRTPTTESYLSGLGLTWPVPRPGEIGAKIGVATARREQSKQQLAASEWQLVRAVYLAHLGVLAADTRLALTTRQVRLAERTAKFFAEARIAGGATAIQENLAATELATLTQQRIHFEGVSVAARQRFNRLLGLAPDRTVKLAGTTGVLNEDPGVELRADVLVQTALERRPDLARLLARYQEAEEELRLEVARQWPALSIGTGLFAIIPLFTKFNRPAIRTASARREAVAHEVRAAIHDLRSEVHMSVAALVNARREVETIEARLLPRLNKALELTDEAFRLRELTLLEILSTQRQVLDTRLRHLDARVERARSRILVETVAGALLGASAREPGVRR